MNNLRSLSLIRSSETLPLNQVVCIRARSSTVGELNTGDFESGPTRLTLGHGDFSSVCIGCSGEILTLAGVPHQFEIALNH